MYPGSWKLEKIKHLFFVKFCVSGVMKIGKKSSIWLSFMCTRWLSFTCTRGHENWWKIKYLILVKCWSWSFVYPGSWKLEKIKHLFFVKFHVPVVMKIGVNWSIWFLWSLMYPGSWKFEKIKVFDFCEVSCTGGSWKLEEIEAFDFCEV